jgi:hypothetical protein
MTCLNPVAKPPTAQGKHSTSSMAAGLHNCTTGQKTKSFRAVSRVGSECGCSGTCPDLYDSALEAARADRIPSHGILRLSYPPGARPDLERAGHCGVSPPGESDATDERYREDRSGRSGAAVLGLDAGCG